MRKNRLGFTLVELAAVIAVLGVLAIIAVPRFIDIRTDAQQSSVNSVAGALNGASATNYAVRKAKSTQGVTVSNCTHVANALPGGALPAGFTITSAAIAADTQVTCTVTRTSGGQIATFIGMGVN